MKLTWCKVRRHLCFELLGSKILLCVSDLQFHPGCSKLQNFLFSHSCIVFHSVCITISLFTHLVVGNLGCFQMLAIVISALMVLGECISYGLRFLCFWGRCPRWNHDGSSAYSFFFFFIKSPNHFV